MDKRSVFLRVLLVIWDIVCVNLCSFMALMMRYDLNFGAVQVAGIKEDYPDGYLTTIIDMALINTIMAIVVFALFKLYHILWRYAGIREFINITLACFLVGALHFMTVFGTFHQLPRSYFIFFTILLFLLTLASRFSYRLFRVTTSVRGRRGRQRNTMIVGGGEACNMILSEYANSDHLDANVCCIIDDDKAKQGTYIHGVRVVGGRDRILACAKQFEI
ncbi:MAG: polysaccharide biosynthesis protein, partial [Eubacterium sp.]|nr:polysaccharide biosynthesis protein [Eubacterium sp.]